MKLSVIGNDLNSKVAASLFASVGNQVSIFDLATLKNVCVNEPNLQSMFEAQLEVDRLSQIDFEREEVFDFSILSDVPSFREYWSDNSKILALVKRSRGIIILSPSSVGEACELQRQLIKEGCNTIVSCIPIIVREGRAIQDFSRADSIVVGSDNVDAFAYIEELFYPFNRLRNTIKKVSTKEAEFACFASHAMLATRLSFMNEMANLAERSNVDIEVVRECMGLDPRIGQDYLYPGCGYGGRALEENVVKVAEQLSERSDDLGLLDIVSKINERQKDLLFRKLWKFYHCELANKTIAIWGAAFKPGSSHFKDSPSMTLINSLVHQSANVVVYDPLAGVQLKHHFKGNMQVSVADSAYEALENANCLVICTEWKEFWSPDFSKFESLLIDKAIFDGRNLYSPDTFSKLNLRYFGIGRGEPI